MAYSVLKLGFYMTYSVLKLGFYMA